MGIQTVAIHSDADANSLHVRMADEAINVGPAPTSQSYLNIPNIVQAIKQTGAQAVHPGYGFLSENAHFVKALDDLGVVFIGPGEHAMAAMGDKIQSKIIAKQSGVHTIPGFDGVVRDEKHAIEIAHEIGYPVMLKASAGGGGKGMRIAWNDKEVEEGFRLASQESQSSFGDSRLLVEKFIDNPRHIEIQLIGDKHGNTLYLPERECSIQRRNQKVIEEAPSTHMNPETRRAMGEQAVALAKHVGYSSAGTVEFLVDSQRNFYFLEMNTRLQVEHPITELITGIDLVEQMIRVAAGQTLSFSQSDVHINGWAFESRVYAEDPSKYLPCIGTLTSYREPTYKSAWGEGIVRCDSGIVEGSEISIYYDPMICKLSTWGKTRNDALTVMKHALDAYVIKGVTHNISLLRDVYMHDRFVTGNISTKFLPEEYPGGFKGHQLTTKSHEELASIAAMVYAKRDQRDTTWLGRDEKRSVNHTQQWDLVVQVEHASVDQLAVSVRRVDGDKLEAQMAYEVRIGNGEWKRVVMNWPIESPIIEASLQDTNVAVQYLEPLTLGFRLQHYGTKFDVTVRNTHQQRLSQHMIPKPKRDLTNFVLSPMPGSVVSVAVKPGDVVSEGAEVAIVEAMKMQNVLHASRAGKVKSVQVKAGQSVQADETLIEFEPEESA